MKLDQVANSKNDNFYTPEYAIKPILKYLNRNSTVWCPFDTEQSHFVKMLRAEGHKVICTHIDNGGDFFNLTPPKLRLHYQQSAVFCKGRSSTAPI